jgi:glycosyltransferase involved in cell wall biosynthesis
MRVGIVIPVFNEARNLHRNISRLHQFLADQDSFTWEVTIVNNGSTDQTLDIARSLSREQPGIQAVHLDQKGRGRALKKVWLESNADILCYMDADLSADLNAFPELIQAVATNAYQLATGSRLLRPESTTRCLKREVASRCYNALVRTVLRTRLSDVQCGFKALTRQAAQHVLPLVEDTGWFFDTELLMLAEKLEYRILDLPVHWVEGRNSHVNILPTALADIRGLIRLRRRLRRGL